MKIVKPINSYQTHVVIDAKDLVEDHQKRYYSVPKDYRMEGNPQDNDPGFSYLSGVIHPYMGAYHEAINLMSQMYWKILADEAEETYKEHGS